MSFFGKIKDAIFGKKAEAAPAAPAQTTVAPAAPTPAAPQPVSEVDVEAILDHLLKTP